MGKKKNLKMSIKRLMDRIHSRESQDQCPPLAHVGQALSMRFTTYLPASALCDRKNIGQINTHTHTQVTVTPSIRSPGLPYRYKKPLCFPIGSSDRCMQCSGVDKSPAWVSRTSRSQVQALSCCFLPKVFFFYNYKYKYKLRWSPELSNISLCYV